MEVELGSLCYMMSHHQSGDAYMLYIPEEIDRDWIKFLHECRNSLAHVSCCNPDQVRKLLDKLPAEFKVYIDKGLEIFLHLDYGELMHGVEKSQAIGRNRVAIMMFLSFVTALGI
ncbi:MAG: hypothetical protein V8S22_03405 [Lachnospiraceae bacterium]